MYVVNAETYHLRGLERLVVVEVAGSLNLHIALSIARADRQSTMCMHLNSVIKRIFFHLPIDKLYSRLFQIQILAKDPMGAEHAILGFAPGHTRSLPEVENTPNIVHAACGYILLGDFAWSPVGRLIFSISL
ncbi:hypothetical protein ACJX0J_018459 [Zea mays]